MVSVYSLGQSSIRNRAGGEFKNRRDTQAFECITRKQSLAREFDSPKATYKRSYSAFIGTGYQQVPASQYAVSSSLT